MADEDDRPLSTRDDYEANYMGGGPVLARSKQRMPNWFFAVMLSIPVIQLVSAVLAHSLAPLLTLPVALLAVLLLSHLRVVLTREVLHIQYGFLGPKIAVSAIESATAEPYDWRRFGGWGVRYSLLEKARAYSVPGGEGAVRVVYRDDKGRPQTVVVTCEDPAAMASAITLARASATGGVRIADEAAVSPRVEAEAAVDEAADAARPKRQGR